MENVSAALRKIGISFKNLALYETAFTHRSRLNESKNVKESNERLEFLGDSILSYIVSSYLYKKRPSDAEGDLTNLRAYMVKTDSLAKASENLRLGELLLLSKGEELSGGRKNHQLLANTYESLLGAIYLDLGIDEAAEFVKNSLFPQFIEEIEKGAPKDSKSLLQEIVQSGKQVSPKYKILGTMGPDHAKQFRVGVFVQGKLAGEGTGFSKQQAEEEAAQIALLKFNQ